MALEQAIITWIHLICSAIWVGGSLFIAIVFAPILKTMVPTMEERLQIMIKVGRRFNKIAVPALLILIATGIWNSKEFLGNPGYLMSSSYGNMLIIKMFLVVALLASFAVHVRIIRKDIEEKIMKKEFDEKQIKKLRKKIIIVGEITVVLSVLILLFAAILDAGL
ncbi:MAG: copper-binding protein [Nitrososphaeria archaeon]|nr:copper-binding protein [Nitrososphaeria archaeon]NDB51131.1 copper-binding protein [Nitrosopumilaceae archaeon]NDB87841.1 copper-binding protein [Nitrososphaerota archaeon]NDB46262.1 copper-binding protein [Nitrososphaeria archaeon]NDB62959.1 copper-binding protein [Nitrosopumilaceae archaeon]